MNKQEYLRLLKQQMNHMDTDASLEIMTHILRIFDEKSAKGFSEREIIEQLGNPSKIISSYQKTLVSSNTDDVSTENETGVETLPLTEEQVTLDSSVSEASTDVPQGSDVKNVSHSNTSAIVRFLLGLMIGLPTLLVLSAIVLAGISISAVAFLQGLIMTFDLPYRIWQFPFTVREDFSLLVGIGLIMVGSGLVTLFLSAFVGIFHAFKNLFKGNFGSAQ